ncbi:MAG: Crp/Fnr family transcriptional regulator [Actinobacteria bacterium]|nr:MAG: Crp/Fnr family transcriptional regulator [Actinomycetota bacterium]
MDLTPPTSRIIRVLEADPGLADGLDDEELRVLLPTAVARVQIVEPGEWAPPEDPQPHRDHIGLLVVRGLVTRTLSVDGRDFTELLGDGDLLRPWQESESWPSVRTERRWHMLTRSELGVLDGRFAMAIGGSPRVQAAIVARAVARSRALAFYLAVSHIRRVEQRLLVMLWHFAERWGRVGPQGVVLGVRLTHETLGRVVGARRPTVTTALTQLMEQGLVSRTPDRRLILHGDPPRGLHGVALTQAASS